MAPPAAPPRRRLTGCRFGRYLVGPVLGTGAAATVYLARLDGPHQFERLLSLKIIHDHLIDQQEFVNLFLDEARLAARLSHPNVVHIYELGREGDQLFMALEYLHGQTLANVFHKLSAASAPIPCDVVAWIGARAADGLHHAHELTDDKGDRLGLVHRDVSPQNLFLTYDGQVKVIDFGIARAEGRLAETEQGKIRGKFRYMAPEQLLGEDFDHRADLFALGVTLYELATGSALFQGKDLTDILGQILDEKIPDPQQTRPDMPSSLASLLRRTLSSNPAERPTTGAQLARELDAIVAASGFIEQKTRLARLMNDLFPDEISQRSRAIAELRAMPSPSDDTLRQDRSATPPPAPEVPTITADLPRRWSIWRIAAPAIAVTAIVASIGLAVALRSQPATRPQPEQSASVTLDIRVQPPIPASIRVAGTLVTSDPPRAAVPRGSETITVEVTADGFDPASIRLIPDRDQFIVVPLVRTAPVSPDASPEATTSVRTPASSPLRPPPVPSDSGVRPHGNPPSTPTGIVKQYPI